jgi:DNA-binding XRE family transcriptional regulator
MPDRVAEINARHEPAHHDALLHKMREVRISKCMSQQTLAVLIGVHTNEIHRWENKHNLPRLDTFLAWLEILGFKIVPPDREPDYEI